MTQKRVIITIEICTLPHFRHHYATKTCQISSILKCRFHSYETSKFCCPKKGQYPKRGPNMSPNCSFMFCRWRYLKNHVHRPILKRNGWKLLHLWPTVPTGTQNCPIPIGQVRDRIWKFAHCHILDIIMQQKTAKFQVYWSTVSIVVTPRNFGAPKRVLPQEGPKYVPNMFLKLCRWRYLKIMCTDQIWSETVENCTIYDRLHILGPKIAPFP